MIAVSGLVIANGALRVGRAPLWLRFPPFHARWRVGHDLVLVFAATRRHLTLQAPMMSNNILSVYSKLDAYMSYRYDFSAFSLFVWMTGLTETMENKGDSRPRPLQGKGCKHWSG